MSGSGYITSEIDFGGGFTNGQGPQTSTPVNCGGANGVVISQVYAAGGTSSSIYRQDYVELFNRGTSAVSLNGWSLQYADATSGTWQVASLSGTINPGQYYLAWGATGSSGQQNAPAADRTTTLDLGSAGGKVALVNTTTALQGPAPSAPILVDFVGYGAANAAEGSAPASAGNAVTAGFRGNGGLEDSDDNFYDFYLDTPAPRNTSSPVANLPPVNTVPSTQWTPVNTSLVFSSAAGRALTVADYDAGSNLLEVSLSASDGTMTLATVSGLTFTAGDGTSDAEMTFQGTTSAINAALDGLTYAPTSGSGGANVLAIVTDDLGASGEGGAQVTVDTVEIAVGAPLLASGRTVLPYEDTAINADVLADVTSIYPGSVAIGIMSPPPHGSAVVNSNGTPSVSVDDYITYIPTPNYSGTDVLTYGVSDQHGNLVTANVTYTITAVNDARIVPPPDQATGEGDLVSVQLATPDRSGPGSLTFSAAGLPAGLSINSATGVISGRPVYTAASTNDGVYNVSVMATGLGDTDTESFVWYVDDIDRILLIDDQASRVGQVVDFTPVVTDAFGNTLTFSAQNLPTGLSINATTGRVSGIIAPQLPGITIFNTTITVSGGSASDSRAFAWNVLSGVTPIVLFAINDTLRTADDITLLDPQLPLSVRVTLYDPLATGPVSVSLQVPSGRSSLNQSMIQLADGQSATVVLTPQQVSQAEDDVLLVAFVGGQQVGQGKATNMQDIEISTNSVAGKIRAANTPTEMDDRIPPRVDTPYTIKYTGPALMTKWFDLRVIGQGDNAGRVELWANSTEKYYPGNIGQAPGSYPGGIYSGKMKGGRQTDPGNAGNLMLAIFRDGEKNDAKAIKMSAGFSVAAIPAVILMMRPKPMEGVNRSERPGVPKIHYGAKYGVRVYSDSLERADLDKVNVSEVLAPVSKSGVFKETPLIVSKFRPAIDPTEYDIHSLAGSPGAQNAFRFTEAEVREALIQQRRIEARNPNVMIVQQYFLFSDSRTGLGENARAKSRYSGFEIRYELSLDAGGFAVVKITKTAAANNGVEAGSMTQAAQATLEDKVK